MNRALRAPLAPLIAAALLGAQDRGAPAAASAPAIEPQVAAAFAAARSRLPEAWREVLADVGLGRAATAGAPANAPLEYALLSRAALAYYATTAERVYVTDHGAAVASGAALPTCRGVDEAALAAFLGRLDGEPGADADADLDPGRAPRAVDVAAWTRFAAAVAAFPDQDGDAAPLDLTDRDAVLTAVVQRGPWVALGARVDLEQLLVHELGHAIQLRDPGFFERMGVWGTLSGWRRSADGLPSDGTWGGRNALEDPIVLVRLLLDRGRGDGRFRPSVTARFPNRYASYDLREDFAEAVRLAAFDPAALAATAPEKLLYVNCVGFVATLSIENPGPMWLDAERLTAVLPPAELVATVLRLSSADPTLPVPDPRAVTAILRTHAPLLAAAGLPTPPRAPRSPSDLPPTRGGDWGAERFAVPIGAATWYPSERSLRAFWEDRITDVVESDLFDAGLEAMLAADAESLGRDRDEIVASPPGRERLAQSVRWLRRARGVVAPAARAAFLAGELAALGGVSRAAALRLGIAATSGEPGSPWAERGFRARSEGPPDAETVDLAFALVGHALDGPEPELHAVEAEILAIPGETYGAARRVLAWLAARDRLAPPPADGARRSPLDVLLLERADETARRVPLPKLRAWLIDLVRGARQR